MNLDELLYALDHAADQVAAAAVMDEVEELVEADPDGIRPSTPLTQRPT